MSCVSLSYVCLKEEVYFEMDEPIADLPQKEQGELMTICGYPAPHSGPGLSLPTLVLPTYTLISP